MRNSKCFQVGLWVGEFGRRLTWALGAWESLSKKEKKKKIKFKKHQLLNLHVLERKAELWSFDSQLQSQRIGMLNLEDLHSHANPQLDSCKMNNLFNMHHDNKACETCQASFVASTGRPAALSVKVFVEKWRAHTTSVNSEKYSRNVHQCKAKVKKRSGEKIHTCFPQLYLVS